MQLSSYELFELNQKLREELKFKSIAQETINAKDQMLKTINENLREAVFRSRKEGGVVYANQAFIELFRYNSVEEVFNTPSENFYVDQEARKKLIQKLEVNGSFKSEEVLYRRKDGTTFWGLVSSVFSKDGTGNEYYDGTLTDISVQKQIEENLRRTN